MRLRVTSRRFVVAASPKECAKALERAVADAGRLALLRKRDECITYCCVGSFALTESPLGALLQRPALVAKASVVPNSCGAEVRFRVLAGVPSLLGMAVLAVAFFGTPVQIVRVALWPSTSRVDKIAALILVPVSIIAGIWAMRFLIRRARTEIESLSQPLEALRHGHSHD